jgi:3-oxoacyl-[acyl-carrier-protein] synthase II
MMERNVVVTGLGTVTPIGNTTAEFWEGLVAGRNGIRTLERFDPSQLGTRMGGEVKNFDVSPYMDAKEARRTDLFVQYAMAAVHQAMTDSGLDAAPPEPERAGALIGTGIGGIITFENQLRVMIEKGPGRVSPFFIPMMIANMASAQVAIRWGLMGPSSTTVTACTSGADAVGSALRMLQAGEAEVMVAGGAEAVITPLVVGGFAVMKALSTRNDAPERASRPFSASRDGFVLGEGAGVLVLETLEHARARGARVYAELVGFGRSADAYHMVEPHPQGAGATLAMRAALREAGLEPSALGYINAHATSTAVGDRAEVLAFRQVLGDAAMRVPISSTKSMTGHMLGAAGAVEAIASVQALVSGVLPPTINLDDPDPELGLDFVPGEPREARPDWVLSNSFAFGGQNGSLVFGRV